MFTQWLCVPLSKFGQAFDDLLQHRSQQPVLGVQRVNGFRELELHPLEPLDLGVLRRERAE